MNRKKNNPTKKELLLFVVIAAIGVMMQIIAYTAAEGHPIVRIIWGCN